MTEAGIHDKDYKQIIERFLSDLVRDQGLTFADARAFVRKELQREYNDRLRARRASFRVIRDERA